MRSSILYVVLAFAVLAALAMMNAVTHALALRPGVAQLVSILALSFAALGLLWFGACPTRRSRGALRRDARETESQPQPGHG